jgi:hypothetical protein
MLLAATLATGRRHDRESSGIRRRRETRIHWRSETWSERFYSRDRKGSDDTLARKQGFAQHTRDNSGGPLAVRLTSTRKRNTPSHCSCRRRQANAETSVGTPAYQGDPVPQTNTDLRACECTSGDREDGASVSRGTQDWPHRAL